MLLPVVVLLVHWTVLQPLGPKYKAGESRLRCHAAEFISAALTPIIYACFLVDLRSSLNAEVSGMRNTSA